MILPEESVTELAGMIYEMFEMTWEIKKDGVPYRHHRLFKILITDRIYFLASCC